MKHEGTSCEQCRPDHPEPAIGECVLCLDAVCAEHCATIVATGRTICGRCLNFRNQIGPHIHTIPLCVALTC